MEYYSFFDSMGSDKRKYNSEDFSRYFNDFFTTGIFLHGDNPLKVSPGTGLSVAVNDGSAVIRGRRYGLEGGDMTLGLDVAIGSARTDRIVLRLSLAPDDRFIKLFVKTGGAEPPEITRTDLIHELSLAQVRVPAGAGSLTTDDITDERYDYSVCGFVNFAAQVITSGTGQYARIAELTTPGVGTFIVPPKVFRIYLRIYGGGGGGGYTSTTNNNGSCGGASGRIEHGVFDVTPGQEIAYVIGPGGAGSTQSGGQYKGATGGSTSILGLVALGGDGGVGGTGTGKGASGGQGSSPNISRAPTDDYAEYSAAPMGGITVPPYVFGSTAYLYSGGISYSAAYAANPFEIGKLDLAAGAYSFLDSLKVGYVQTQAVLREGHYGGAGVASEFATAGGDGLGYGNGGGGLSTRATGGRGGNGSPGAILIYTWGGGDDV